MCLSKFNKIDIGVVALLSVLYVMPILSANVLYIDDMGRSMYGYSGWDNNARPLASLVMQMLAGGTPLQNIYPLPQILGAIATGIAGLVLCRSIMPQIEGLPLYCCSKPFFPRKSILPV